MKTSNKKQLLSIFRKDPILERTISRLTKGGEKSKATKILSKVLRKIPSTSTLIRAVQNSQPFLEVRSVRASRMTRQIPIGIPTNRQEGIAIRWLLDAARTKKKSSSLHFANLLQHEVEEAANWKGSVITRRNELHKLANANRVFARTRWW